VQAGSLEGRAPTCHAPGMRALPSLVSVTAALCLSALLAPARAAAEDQAPWDRPTPHRALGLYLGPAFAFPSSDRIENGSGEGIFGGAEYAFWPDSWFSPRLYGGFSFTKPRSDCGAGVSPCEVASSFAFMGVKTRFLVPIPWVAPFVEVGLGASFGHFSTRVGTLVDREVGGALLDVPWSLGLALGSRRQCELSVQFLSHARAEQTTGGLAIGLRVPVG
jgi:hypothetical protein